MEDRLDYLFEEWHKLGGEVLLRETKNFSLSRTSEEIIAESTSFCRNSGRLMWIVLDWFVRNIENLNEKKIIDATKKIGDLSVLGVLCDLASSRAPSPKFDKIKRLCKPCTKHEIFFHRVAKSPLASKLTKDNPDKIFSNWNFLCNEVRYLH